MGDNLSSLTFSLLLTILSAYAALPFIFFFSSQSTFKTLNHLIAFLSIFFHSALSSLGSGRGRENLHKQFQAQQIYGGLLVLCFVFLFLP